MQALENAFRQGFFDNGGTNMDDTGSALFDLLAENCVTTTQQANALGRSIGAQNRAAPVDPGGAVDIPHLAGAEYIPNAPVGPTPSPTGAGLDVVYGAGSGPQGQPALPETGYATPFGSGGYGGGVVSGASGGFSSSGFAASGGVRIDGPGGTPIGISFGQGAGAGGINWLLIAAVAAGAYFLLRKG